MTGLEGNSTSLIAYNAGYTAYYLLKIITFLTILDYKCKIISYLQNDSHLLNTSEIIKWCQYAFLNIAYVCLEWYTIKVHLLWFAVYTVSLQYAVTVLGLHFDSTIVCFHWLRLECNTTSLFNAYTVYCLLIAKNYNWSIMHSICQYWL